MVCLFDFPKIGSQYIAQANLKLKILPLCCSKTRIIGMQCCVKTAELLILVFFVCLFDFLEIGSQYIAQASLKFKILPPVQFKGWDYRHAVLCQNSTITVSCILVVSLYH